MTYYITCLYMLYDMLYNMFMYVILLKTVYVGQDIGGGVGSISCQGSVGFKVGHSSQGES